MTGRRKASKDDLAQRYARRWNVELDLRSIKTTMGMEVLHCQTAEMNDKELWVHLLAYNLIRLLMGLTAVGYAGVRHASVEEHTRQLPQL
jgi:IS4 transposase